MRIQDLHFQSKVFSSGILGSLAMAALCLSSSVAQAKAPSLGKKYQIEDKRDAGENSPGYAFEVSCDLHGGSLSLSEPDYSAARELLPPELAKCSVFGNQDQARYICLCSDLKDPLSGAIDGALLPAAFPEPGDEDVGDALLRVCQDKFHSACGPFPQPIEINCSGERGGCGLAAMGYRRNGGYQEYESGCECEDGRAYFTLQKHAEELDFKEENGPGICERSLQFCEPGGAPRLEPFQSLPAASYEREAVSCVRETETREDDCVVRTGGKNQLDEYACYCSGTEIEGKIPAAGEQGMAGRWGSCERLLDKCAQFEPVQDDDDEDADEGSEEEEEQNPNDPKKEGPGVDGVLDSIGCNTGAPLGAGSWLAGAVLLLGAGLRRRRLIKRS